MNKIAFPKFKKYDGQPVRYIQPKYDGHLMKISVSEIGIQVRRIHVLTKNDKDVTAKILNIEHICDELIGLPSQSQIFAELHCPGRFSTDVPTMLNEANEDLHLTAFAAPMLDGSNFPNHLIETMDILRDLGIDAVKTIIRQMESISKIQQKAMLTKAIEQKLEGWVLKESHMSGWYKLKPTKIVDCFVTGTEQSFSPTHYGGLKCIHVVVWELPLHTQLTLPKLMNLGHVGSGFEAEFRAKYNTNKKRDTLIGRVCEVEYDSIAAGGKLRFPRFVRWRTDKDKDQCTTEQFN